MTRGNQRDVDRARALQRAAANAGGNSTLKDADEHASKLRAKQAANDAKKAQEEEEAIQLKLQEADEERNRKLATEQLHSSKLATIAANKQRAEEEWLREQEEERERMAQARAAKRKEAEEKAAAAEAARKVEAAAATAAAAAAAAAPAAAPPPPPPLPAAAAAAAEPEEDTGPGRYGSGGEKILASMVSNSHALNTLLEIEMSRSVVSRLGNAVLGVAVVELRALAKGAEVYVNKFVDGGATLVAKAPPIQLVAIAAATKRLLASFEEASAEDDDEYCPRPVPLGPREAAMVPSFKLAPIPCRYDVRLKKKRTADGWLEFDLRGPEGAAADGVRFIEALLAEEEAKAEADDAAFSAKAAIVREQQPHSSPTDAPSFSTTVEDGVVRIAVKETALLGRVIGQRGATIRELRESFEGIILDVNKNDGLGTITIKGGDAASVASLRSDVERLLTDGDDLGKPASRESTRGGHAVLRVPAPCVGALLGRNGAVLNFIRNRSGADISLNKQPDGSARVSVRGDALASKIATFEIQRAIQRKETLSGGAH